MAYLNEVKEKRARAVVANPNSFETEAVERKALKIAQDEKLEGEALVARIYGLLGGLVGEVKEVAETRQLGGRRKVK